MTTRTISLLGQLQRDHDKAKEQYSIYQTLKNEGHSMYYLGKMDGIEAAIKQVAIYENEAN